MITKYQSEPVVISANGSDDYCAAGSGAVAYAAWFHKVRKDGYTINALLRGGEQGELTLVDHGGPYREYFERGKGRASHRKCARRNISDLSEKEILQWSKPFGQEGEHRFVWLTSNRGYTFCARLARTGYIAQVRSHFNVFEQAEVEKNQLNVCLITQKRRHDCIHDPWFPDYPNLHGIVLQELRGKACSEVSSKTILQFTDEQIKEKAEIFFSEDRILSGTGRKPGPDVQTALFRKMLHCMRNLKPTKSIYGGYVTCRPGYFAYQYEREVSCYDGGNCGTDIESLTVAFKICRKDLPPWEDLIRESEHAHANQTREEAVERWKRRWECSDLPEDSEKIQICVLQERILYLLDPFGMKGIFCFFVD